MTECSSAESKICDDSLNQVGEGAIYNVTADDGAAFQVAVLLCHFVKCLTSARAAR